MERRFIGKLQSALLEGARKAQERRLNHEAGHIDIDQTPQDQEIVLMVDPSFRECLDTRVIQIKTGYNPSVHLEEDPRLDPAS